MGQVLHGSATTTEAVRRAIQRSQESLRALAKRYGINQKTVAKWRNRNSVADERTGPRDPKSTVLTVEEEAIIVTFRRHTLLPLDDCLYALQAARPYPQPLRQSPKGDILILHKQGTFSLCVDNGAAAVDLALRLEEDAAGRGGCVAPSREAGAGG